MPRRDPWYRARAYALACLAGAGATVLAPAKPSAVERIQGDAKKLASLVSAPFTRRFLEATRELPHVAHPVPRRRQIALLHRAT